MSDMHRRPRREEQSEDHPPYSRLFVLCGKQVPEQELKEVFSRFGSVEDIKMPRDHNTGELKGVAYVKYYKTSDAAQAVEEMNLKKLDSSSRPLKVMVAASRSDIQSNNDEEKYKRLFITVPKVATEDELNEHFSQFGRIESLLIQRDRSTGENKGFAYVKYSRFLEAAKAFEDSDRKYRPIFAAPKKRQQRLETSFESNIQSLQRSSSSMSNITAMMNCQPQGYTRVKAICSPFLTQSHLERLFDIVPGLTQCQYMVDLVRDCGKAFVSFSNPTSATYAVEKLDGFEYPPGQKIFVQPDYSKIEPGMRRLPNEIPNVINNLQMAMTSNNSATPDLARLAEAIAEASSLIKAATQGITDQNIPDSNDLSYCSVKLPPPQPLAEIDSPVAKRCFLVCKPQPPSLTVLRDIFCRFGDLINVYTLPNKTVGYARYSTARAADEAIRTLHGAEVCGVRMKVLEADERGGVYENDAKRMKMF